MVACRKIGLDCQVLEGRDQGPLGPTVFPTRPRPRGGAHCVKYRPEKTVLGNTNTERQERWIGGAGAAWIPFPVLSPW